MSPINRVEIDHRSSRSFNPLPLVSVVIPAFNEEKHIQATIQLLKQQTYPPDHLEIIVVDNQSTDQTARKARAAGARVVVESRRGVGWAREAGWRVASGEIIASTDADARPPTDWIERVVILFNQHPELIGLTGGQRFFDKSRWFNVLASLFNPFLVYLGFFMSRGVYNFTGNNMAVRAWGYRKARGFNTSLYFGEDMDLARRLKRIGKIAFYPRLIVRVSGRRYRMNQTFWRYFVNYLWTSLFARPKFNELPPVH